MARKLSHILKTRFYFVSIAPKNEQKCLKYKSKIYR